MSRFYTRFVLVVLLTVTGCGGGPGGTTTGTARSGSQVGSAVLTLAIPSGSSSTGSATSRHAMYIDPATQSVAVTVNGATPQVNNVGPSSPSCTQGTGTSGTTCTITLSAPYGTDTFEIDLYSGQNATGTVLGTATVTGQVNAGKPFVIDAIISSTIPTLAIYVADSVYQNSIGRFAANANGSAAPTLVQTGGQQPWSVQFDSSGNMYVLFFDYTPIGDAIGIYAYDADSNSYASTPELIGGSSTGIVSPGSMWVNNGKIYVVDEDGEIVIFPTSARGNVLPSMMINGVPDNLSFPEYIATDPAGTTIYVANSFGSPYAIQEFSASNGQYIGSITGTNSGGAFTSGNAPGGLAIDSSGNLYVGSSNKVIVFPPGASGNATPLRTITASSGGGFNGLALDNNGNLFATQTTGSVGSVTAYTASSSGSVAPNASMPYQQAIQYLNGGDIAVDPFGNVWVGNPFGNTITGYQVVGAPGDGTFGSAMYSMQLGSVALQRPYGMAFDQNGNLWVANNAGNSIVELSPTASGTATALNTLTDVGTLRQPNGLTFDASGNLWVTDRSSGSPAIAEFAPGATGNVAPLARIVGSNTGLSRPDGIALDQSHKIYVANHNAGNVLIFAAGSNGNVAPTATLGGTNTLISDPSGLALDSQGYIYVRSSSSTGSSIQVFAPGSTGNVAPVRNIAGSATLLTACEIGVNSSITGCRGLLAVDAQQNIYVGTLGTTPGQIAIFSSTANGNAQPFRTINLPSSILEASGIAISPTQP